MGTTNYANGTWLRTSTMWDVFTAARVMCPDGKVRNVKRIAPVSESFLGIRAAVTFRGRTVAGLVSVETLNDSQSTVTFTPSGRNAGLFHVHEVAEIYSIPDRVMGASLIRGAQVTKCSCGHTMSYEPRS